MTVIKAEWLTSKPAQRVCLLLTSAGHQAFFVGGCVRNALLDAPVSDLDIATDALPTTVMELAKSAGIKAIPTGIDHGTVTLIVDDTPFEVTTFRNDIATDGRRAVVAFSDNVIDDARRRDFTMNALYCDPDGQVLDPLNGLPDLQTRRVRFIEDADRRIQEDYLRILRFFRFHAWYGNADDGIDRDGLAACAGNVDGIDGLSAERIGQEMLKLLAAPDPAPSLASMSACGALLRVLPGAGSDTLTVLVHVEHAAGLAPDPMRRLAVLGGQDVANRLRLSNAQAARLETLTTAQARAGVLGYEFGADLAIDILAVRAASFGNEILPADIAEAHHGARQMFPLTAADLMPKLEGKALGEALKSAKTRWLESDFTLTKDDLLA